MIVDQRLPRPMAGFTLMELLVALTLMGLLMLVLFPTLRLGSRSWEAAERLADSQEEIRAAQQFLLDRLLAIREVPRRQNRRVMVFSGDTQSVEFVAPLSTSQALPGLQLLRLELIQDAGIGYLVLRRRLWHPDLVNGDGTDFPPLRRLPDSDAEVQRLEEGLHILVSEVTQLTINYFGQSALPTANQQQGWRDEWREQPGIPEAIHIRIETRSGSLPDFVVPLGTP